MRRLCIFFFYDSQGVVDDYVFYFLSEMKCFCEQICFISNGKIRECDREKISNKYVLIERENKGLDAYAYKTGIEFYGYDKLSEFDEVICCNFTIYGPIFSMKSMFAQMESKQCDWWGLFKWWTSAFVEYQHIPSFFVVYRKKLVASQDFKNYWESMPDISNYADSVKYHEQRQTPYFDSKGYKSSVLIDDGEYKSYWPYHWPLMCQQSLIKKYKFPFVKRRSFFIENGRFVYGNLTTDLISEIKSSSNYDVQLILNNILRTQKIADVFVGYPFFKYLKYKVLSLLNGKRTYYYRSKIPSSLTTEQNLEYLFKK